MFNWSQRIFNQLQRIFNFRDAEAAVGAFIDGVRDLEPTDFSKVFDWIKDPYSHANFFLWSLWLNLYTKKEKEKYFMTPLFAIKIEINAKTKIVYNSIIAWRRPLQHIFELRKISNSSRLVEDDFHKRTKTICESS